MKQSVRLTLLHGNASVSSVLLGQLVQHMHCSLTEHVGRGVLGIARVYTNTYTELAK